MPGTRPELSTGLQKKIVSSGMSWAMLQYGVVNGPPGLVDEKTSTSSISFDVPPCTWVAPVVYHGAANVWFMVVVGGWMLMSYGPAASCGRPV